MQTRAIKNILTDLLSSNPKQSHLRKEEFTTSSQKKLINLVKSQNILLEVIKVNHQSEEHELYRLKSTASNIKRAKALLEVLP